MASIHARTTASGEQLWKVHWRHDGRQRTLTFGSIEAATTHKLNVEKFGHARAMAALGVTEAHDGGSTVGEALAHHVDSLTGVEPGTIKRYRDLIARDFVTIEQMPLTAVTEHTIAQWVHWLERHTVETTDRRGKRIEKVVTNAGKTIANKHGLLSAALARAVREGKITQNPCERTRLPRKDAVEEPVFLSRDDFDQLLDVMPEQWRPLTRWLVATGTRFSEATALKVGDVTVLEDGSATCRITSAWKWTGTTDSRLSYPKSRAGRRTINVPAAALTDVDLDRPKSKLLFTNRVGERVTYSRYYDGGWKPAMEKGAPKCSPHDLRHTCASWMIAAGVPLPVIQAHLGHESITVTIGVYGHLDRTSHAAAAAAIGRVLG